MPAQGTDLPGNLHHSSTEPGSYQRQDKLDLRRMYGDSRFVSFARDVACNHFPENLEMKIMLPKGVSKEQVDSLIKKTLQMAKSKMPNTVKGNKAEPEKPYQLITKRESLLQNIKSLLTDTTFLKLNQLDLDRETKEGAEGAPKAKVQLSPVANMHFEEIVRNFNEQSTLIQYCQGTKDLNVAFQKFIMNLSQDQIGLIRSMAIREFGVLIFNKHGNYLIQRILQRDRLYSDFVTKTCVEKFKVFASNEYSSRVMQTLIRERSDFRTFVHQYFAKDVGYGVSKITVTFLLLIAMRYAEDSEEYVYVHNELVKDCTLYEYKLFKRILISYFQFAKSSMISETWRLIMETQTFESFFDKKFSSLILLMVVRRNFEPAILDIAWHISKKLGSLIRRKYFKVVIEKLLQPKYKSCRSALNSSLSAIPLHELAVLLKESREHFNFYLYITIASFRESEGSQLEAYLKKIKHLIPAEAIGL